AIERVTLDVRDREALVEALRGVECVFHLAAVNGTENFYTQPQLVLDVGVRGALAVTEACIEAGVPDLVVASSAEVYQTPRVVPT
ncbi:NAD-dependent dehydratase, partial [Escherichia coli]